MCPKTLLKKDNSSFLRLTHCLPERMVTKRDRLALPEEEGWPGNLESRSAFFLGLAEFFSQVGIQMAQTSSSGTSAIVTGGVSTPGANPIHTAVTVSLRVDLDVSGEAQLFAYPADAADNPVVCTGTFNAASLTGLFDYWEDANRGSVNGKKGVSNVAKAALCKTDFASIIAQAMDASGAVPFNTHKDNAANYNYTSFGELALGYAAKKLFGHPQAVAAISNDAAIVTYFNGNGSGMNMPGLLETALKEIANTDVALIAASVIGQDADRAEGQGDNKSEADAKPLRFYAGDTVFVRVTMQQWAVSVANANQLSNTASYSTGTQSFDLVIRVA